MQQIAFFNKLVDDVGDLHKEVIVFCSSIMTAELMFQIVAFVFLHIKSFIFNFPSKPPILH